MKPQGFITKSLESEVTIYMALFKILKGPEKKDSAGKSVMLDPVASSLAIKEGWAYVTDEGNFYVDISDSSRVKINQNADYANIAYNDGAGQSITSTYIKEISFLTDNNSQIGAASNPYLKYLLGNNTPKALALPAASTTNGGILTLDQQDLMGLKIFWDGIRQSVTLAPTNNLDYSVGYYTYTTNADGKTITTSLNLGGLTYNPNTKTLSADNFYGLAAKATADASDQTITSTYIKDIKYFADGSNPYYTLILGSGATKLDPNDTTGKTIEKITIPVADTTNAGIVTIDAQTFAGEKTFKSLITATSGLYSKDNITTEKQFISTVASGTAPFQVTSSTKVSGLNVDMVDGLHASNDPFTSGSASQTILPTQHAIWTSLNSLLTAAQALVYRGTIDPKNSNTHPTSGLANGDTYVITAEGNFAGVYCEPGDLAIYCNSSWDIIQVNINGAVTIKDGGAYNTAHTTDHAIARFDGTTGRIIQNSSILIDDNGNLLPNTDKTQTIGSATAIWGTIYGTATHAVKDGNNNNIAGYYVHNITLDSTSHIFDLKNGNNISLGTISPKFAGSSSCGGAATSAVKLDKSITLSLTGDISGSATFDGSSNFSITTKINNSGIFYVDGSSSTTAGTWIGTNTNIADLVPGLTIAYKIGIAGGTTVTTLKLTIASGTTEAITVKRNTSSLTTQLPVGTVVLLTYDGTNWCWADYNADTPILKVYRQITGYDGDYPILVSRTALSRIGTAGRNGSSSNVYGIISQNGKYTPTINPYTGVVKIKATTASTSTTTGALIVSGGIGAAGNIYGSKVYNAVWNDYAEFRKAETLEPGRVVIEDASGEMKLSSERLQPGASIISDTFGSAMGETEECKTPIAVAGRVLTYYHGDINMYTVGAAVGTGPNGTVSLMTREEIMAYPDRIVGIVSEIPSYEEWGPEHIKVNGRIWIKIK